MHAVREGFEGWYAVSVIRAAINGAKSNQENVTRDYAQAETKL